MRSRISCKTLFFFLFLFFLQEHPASYQLDFCKFPAPAGFQTRCTTCELQDFASSGPGHQDTAPSPIPAGSSSSDLSFPASGKPRQIFGWGREGMLSKANLQQQPCSVGSKSVAGIVWDTGRAPGKIQAGILCSHRGKTHPATQGGKGICCWCL